MHCCTHSYWGNALRTVREDDQCANAKGLNVVRLTIEVFAIACFLVGIAGALWAHSTGYVNPADFRFAESIRILAMVVVAGLAACRAPSSAQHFCCFCPRRRGRSGRCAS